MENIILLICYISSILLMGTGLVWLVVYAAKSRVTYSFMVCQLLLMLWSGTQLMAMEAINTRQLYIVYGIANIAICGIGSCWLIFALYFAEKKIKIWEYVILIGMPVIHLTAMLTTHKHHLFYSVFEYGNVQRGILFWTNTVYTYVCIVLGIYLICKACFVNRFYSRGQGVLLSLGVIVPMGFNIIYLLGIVKSSMDITPIFFTVSSLSVLLATYNYGFLNVNGIAIEKVFRKISEGIIIVNKKGDITYVNESAKEYVNDCRNIEEVFKSMGIENVGGYREIAYGDRILSLKEYEHRNRVGNIIANTIVMGDVTKYHQLIEKTEELSKTNQVLAIEKERNRIAQEVHDTTGHTLTMINTLIKLIRIELEKGGEKTGEYIDEGERLATEGITELRQAINSMKKEKGYTLLTQYIEELVSNVAGAECELTVMGTDGERYIGCAKIMYECCREAITNTLRYAGANKIDIIIRLEENSCELHVIDDGAGTEKIVPGNGIDGIVTRVEQFGGEVTFVSGKNEGFRMTVKLPVGEVIK